MVWCTGSSVRFTARLLDLDRDIGSTLFAATRPKLTPQDLLADSTFRDFRVLDEVLGHIEGNEDLDTRPTLVDLGCGYGGMTAYVASRLEVSEVHGLDLDEKRLGVARDRGVRAHRADLERDHYPFDDASADIVLSFGAFEHLVWYDHVMSETARILRDGGYFVVSKPNLGSYINRAALLFGFQPRDIEVSEECSAGVLPQHRQKPLAHIHSATLRAMTDLLDHRGFSIERTYGFSPDFGNRMVSAIDRALGRFPSISRRYIIVARRGKR